MKLNMLIDIIINDMKINMLINIIINDMFFFINTEDSLEDEYRGNEISISTL